MGKKHIKVFFMVVVIIYFLYLFSYIFYFDSFCSKYSSYEKTLLVDLKTLARCNDSIVCEITDRTKVLNKLETWTCIKKRVDYFEIDYYTK